jgi:sugar phosphate isomerase/epimerase
MASAISVGLDSYSYHRYFGETTAWEKPVGVRWTPSDFLRRAHALGVGTVSLQTVYLPELTPDTIAALRAELAALSLRPVLAWGHPAGLAGGEDPAKVEELSRLLPRAKALGCSLVRFVCGNQFTGKLPVAARIERLTPILRRLSGEAAGLDLTLAVENHADFRMQDLVTLVRGVGAANLGICFDTGNAVRVGDDLLDAARLALPLIRMVHLKDMIVVDTSRGDPTAWWPSAPLGRGQFNIAAFVEVLHAGGYLGTLFVEMANTYPEWPDEDAAVAASIAYLTGLLSETA